MKILHRPASNPANGLPTSFARWNLWTLLMIGAIFWAKYMKRHEIKIVSDRSGYYWGVRYTPGRVSAVHWEKHGGTSCAQHSSPVASYGHQYHPGALSQYMAQMAIKGYSTNKYPMKGCLMFPNDCTVSMSCKHKHLLDHICIDSLYWHSWFIRAGCIIKNPPSHCRGSIRYPWPQHKIYFKRQTSINTAWPIKVEANSFRDKQKTRGYPCNTTSWIILGCDHCCIGWGRLCQCEGCLFCRRHWQTETWTKYNKILMPNQNSYQANQDKQEWKILDCTCVTAWSPLRDEQREKLGEACKHEIANTGFPMISVWNVSIRPARLWIRPQTCVPSDQKVQHQTMACHIVALWTTC